MVEIEEIMTGQHNGGDRKSDDVVAAAFCILTRSALPWTVSTEQAMK
jgi:hypothetical protein